MIWLVLSVQIALPLALIAWLALLPAGSIAGFALQVAGTGALLLALALVAQWAVVPWWLPRLYGLLWAAAILWPLLDGRLRGLSWVPEGRAGWALAALSVLLLGLGAWYAAQALRGRTPPPVAVVDIASPFGAGKYLVGSGGGLQIVNAHLRTLDPGVPRYRAWRGQSYAVDFFGLNRLGTRASGLRPPEPASYAIFGAPVHAPCAGEVLAAEAAMPDFRVPEQDAVNRLGNHVLLRCADAVIVLAHLQKGSVTVAAGDSVSTGQRLARVGNSGASTEPHLHIHAQRPAEPGAPPISGAPLALRIDGRFLVRGDRLDGAAR